MSALIETTLKDAVVITLPLRRPVAPPRDIVVAADASSVALAMVSCVLRVDDDHDREKSRVGS